MLGVELQARELDLLGEVTRRFIDVVAAQERLRLARETVDLVEKSVLDSARQSLASMWGGAEARFGAAKADLFSLAPLASFEVLLEKLDRNPDFVRFASESRLREAELRLAQAQARPNLTLGLGLRRYEGSNDTALVAGFSIGLPLFDRNQGNIAEAAARRAQSQAQERAARIRARATLYGLFQQVRASRRQLTTLQRDALPQAQAALEQTQTGYDRGRFSYLELATAQQDLLALRTAVIDAAADAHRLTAEIERLTNEPVATTSQDFRTPP
jgi:cobalt-zinc-cadmium efflux system outer membrane protein